LLFLFFLYFFVPLFCQAHYLTHFGSLFVCVHLGSSFTFPFCDILFAPFFFFQGPARAPPLLVLLPQKILFTHLFLLLPFCLLLFFSALNLFSMFFGTKYLVLPPPWSSGGPSKLLPFFLTTPRLSSTCCLAAVPYTAELFVVFSVCPFLVCDKFVVDPLPSVWLFSFQETQSPCRPVRLVQEYLGRLGV